MSYSPPGNDTVDFELSSSYTPAGNDNTDFTLRTVEPTTVTGVVETTTTFDEGIETVTLPAEIITESANTNTTLDIKLSTSALTTKSASVLTTTNLLESVTETDLETGLFVGQKITQTSSSTAGDSVLQGTIQQSTSTNTTLQEVFKRVGLQQQNIARKYNTVTDTDTVVQGELTKTSSTTSVFSSQIISTIFSPFATTTSLRQTVSDVTVIINVIERKLRYSKSASTQPLSFSKTVTERALQRNLTDVDRTLNIEK